MFERRLKILLFILFGFTVVMVLRSAHVQLVNKSYWSQRAAETMKRSRLIDTTRGPILDCQGREVAVDLPCIDACVDYRALLREPDAKWLRDKAGERLTNRMGEAFTKAARSRRKELLDQEVIATRNDIDTMWNVLARISGQTSDDIEEIRQAILSRVEMRRRAVWYRNYELALRRHEQREPAPWYRQWLVDESQQAPQLDSFAITVAEQTEAHVIVRALSTEACNFFSRDLGRYPGLVLRPGTHRAYPFGDAAAHVIGHQSRVLREDLKKQEARKAELTSLADKDKEADEFELRQYLPNDLIGRTGLEACCKPLLHGLRGREQRILGDEKKVVDRREPVEARAFV